MELLIRSFITSLILVLYLYILSLMYINQQLLNQIEYYKNLYYEKDAALVNLQEERLEGIPYGN